MADDFGMDWVDDKEKEIQEEREKGYLVIKEGDNRFVLLSNIAPFAQIFDPATKKYRPAQEGDKGASIKGICWVGQENMVKQAALSYTVVKALRAIQMNKDWEFTIPFAHVLTLNAVGAGTKEVKYTLTASPKTIEIPAAMLEELKKKPKPEEVVEKKRGGKKEESSYEYPEPTTEIGPDDLPF